MEYLCARATCSALDSLTKLHCHLKIYLPGFPFLPSPSTGGSEFQSEGFPCLLLFFHRQFLQ